MNVSSTSSTPGNAGASSASSSNSSPYEYQRSAGPSTRPTNVVTANPPTNADAQITSSKASTSLISVIPGASTDHLGQLTQMAQGVGLIKSENGLIKTEGDLGTSASANFAVDPLYQHNLAAVAYAQNWQYYQQLGHPMGVTSGLPNWPQYYPPGHWQNFNNTKKGRQTYQRFQTSVLESKFQQSSYVSKKQREELRVQTSLTDRQIKIWFQNRRMKAKKEKNRTEDSIEHPNLPPSNGSSKSLNNSSSSLNGSNAGALVGSANFGMLGGPHSFTNEELMGMMDNDDGKHPFKMSMLPNGMGSNSMAVPSSWQACNAAATGAMLNNVDPTWSQFIPQGTHSQSIQYSSYPYPTFPSNN